MQKLKISSPDLSTELFSINVIGSSVTPRQLAELYIDEIGLPQGTKISRIINRKTGKELSQNESLSAQGIKRLDDISIDFERTAGGGIVGYRAKRKDKENIYNTTLLVESTGKRIPVNLVSSNVTIYELVSALAEKINIKMPTNFDVIRYYTRQHLEHNLTLEACEIGDDELIIVDFQELAHEPVQKNTKIEEAERDSETFELISENRLRCTFPALSLLTVSQYLELITTKIQSLEFVYSILAILVSTDTQNAIAFLKYIVESPDQRAISASELSRFTTSIEPLRILSARYGSPVSFDILGIGKILEIIRDIFKDVSWREKHESNMAHNDENIAKLNIRQKETEITRSRLELEKTALDLQMKKIENEKTSIEVLEKKIEILEKASNLRMSDNDKKQIMAILVPKISTIKNSGVFD